MPNCQDCGNSHILCECQKIERGTLRPGEPHPGYQTAKMYLMESDCDLPGLLEAFSSCAIEGNKTAEICAETLSRLIQRKPVSDRYLMGLAWEVYSLDRMQEITNRTRKELIRDRENYFK